MYDILLYYVVSCNVMQVENKQCCLVYFAIYFGWKSDLDDTRSDEY